MNNKGFISVTVIYSFFLVFLTLMMLIIVNMVTNRNLVNNIKNAIKGDSTLELKLISDVCDDGDYLSACITYLGAKGLSSNTNLYYHNNKLTNGAGDNSYRYAGSSENVNNYICLGSTTIPCPDANLFRIIGVMNGNVKVIKATSIGNMKWDSETSNVWSTSSLNAYLQGTYLSSINSFSNKIATAIWKLEGNTYNNIMYSTPKVVYQYEVGNSSATAVYSAKIGLMYVSDYAYAADRGWIVDMASYSNLKSSNWLYLGELEWTISRPSDDTEYAFVIYSNGGLSRYYVGNHYEVSYNAVRPVFYLKSNVVYLSGTGTSSDPIRIS